MKTFIKIIIILGFLILFSLCKKSTEEKIIEKIDLVNNYYDSKIVNLEIIDTIYQKDIISKLKMDTLRLEYLKERREIFSNKIDSLRKTSRPKHIDSIKMMNDRFIIDSLMIYDNWIDFIYEQNDYYQILYNFYDNSDDIKAYRVIIHYKNGRINDLIIKSNYGILCSSFLFEPIDSIIKFRPNDYRKIPHNLNNRR
jgi:hypothetical protein